MVSAFHWVEMGSLRAVSEAHHLYVYVHVFSDVGLQMYTGDPVDIRTNTAIISDYYWSYKQLNLIGFSR